MISNPSALSGRHMFAINLHAVDEYYLFKGIYFRSGMSCKIDAFIFNFIEEPAFQIVSDSLHD